MLIAFTGLGGAGKTTAIKYLEQRGFGVHVYLGQAIFDEIRRLGLEPSPEVELQVRMSLRDRLGPSACVELRAPYIGELLQRGDCPLIDAIFKPQEYERVKQCGQAKTALVAIETSFELRRTRLAARKDRPLTADELRARDLKEIYELGTGSVIESADIRISNDGSFDDLYRSIETTWKTWTGG